MFELPIAARLQQLRADLAAQNFDAVFLLNTSNVSYMSGYTNEDAFLLISNEAHGAANVLITDFRYTEQAAEECPDYEIMLHRNSAPPLAARLQELCAKYQIKRLAFEKDYVNYGQYADIAAALQEAELCPSAGLVEQIRYIKDESEQHKLKMACQATDRVFSAMCDVIRPGLSEKEIEWELIRNIYAQGCTLSFPCIVVSGPRGSLPHGVASERKVQSGEMVTMDFGCLYEGYHADITRTVCVGKPDDEMKRIYGIVLEANLRAETEIRAGIKGSVIDAAARDYITEKGYGNYFGHGLGHGVGLDIHENPFMNRTCEHILQEDCFITVEPGIYLPGKGGVRIEDTVWVKENGAVIMFQSKKELICL